MPILQSGSITPGHIALWATDGVLRDGGPLGASQRVLASLGSANFNDTGDQPIALPSRVTAFLLTGILVTNAAIALNTAVGGFYPTVAKGGTALVANTQVYSSLTTINKLLSCTLTSGVPTTRYSSANMDVIAGQLTLYFSLTTAQGIATVADCYVLGVDLS